MDRAYLKPVFTTMGEQSSTPDQHGNALGEEAPSGEFDDGSDSDGPYRYGPWRSRRKAIWLT
jgi:hypothetical protein